MSDEKAIEEMKQVFTTDECGETLHWFPGTAKPGDKCKCGKEVFFPELVKH